MADEPYPISGQVRMIAEEAKGPHATKTLGDALGYLESEYNKQTRIQHANARAEHATELLKAAYTNTPPNHKPDDPRPPFNEAKAKEQLVTQFPWLQVEPGQPGWEHPNNQQRMNREAMTDQVRYQSELLHSRNPNAMDIYRMAMGRPDKEYK
jgi:hypothetical protein